jgi:hypothetical protein
MLVGGIVVTGLGIGLYIGAGLGPGPRDGLMTGLAARGVGSIRAVRTGIELSALTVGWLLGGSVGLGTVIVAVTIGPNVQFFLPRLAVGGNPSPDLRVPVVPEVDPEPGGPPLPLAASARATPGAGSRH